MQSCETKSECLEVYIRKLLDGAKEKITKIVMTSTNRVVGGIEDIKRESEAFKSSDVI